VTASFRRWWWSRTSYSDRCTRFNCLLLKSNFLQLITTNQTWRKNSMPVKKPQGNYWKKWENFKVSSVDLGAPILLRARNSPSPPWEKDHHTPALYEQCLCSLTSYRIYIYIGLWDEAYGLLFLYEKTAKSDRLKNVFTKAALSSLLFKDTECLCGQGLDHLNRAAVKQQPCHIFHKRSLCHVFYFVDWFMISACQNLTAQRLRDGPLEKLWGV